MNGNLTQNRHLGVRVIWTRGLSRINTGKGRFTGSGKTAFSVKSKHLTNLARWLRCLPAGFMIVYFFK